MTIPVSGGVCDFVSSADCQAPGADDVTGEGTTAATIAPAAGSASSTPAVTTVPNAGAFDPANSPDSLDPPAAPGASALADPKAAPTAVSPPAAQSSTGVSAGPKKAAPPKDDLRLYKKYTEDNQKFCGADCTPKSVMADQRFLQQEIKAAGLDGPLLKETFKNGKPDAAFGQECQKALAALLEKKYGATLADYDAWCGSQQPKGGSFRAFIAAGAPKEKEDATAAPIATTGAPAATLPKTPDPEGAAAAALKAPAPAEAPSPAVVAEVPPRLMQPPPGSPARKGPSAPPVAPSAEPVPVRPPAAEPQDRLTMDLRPGDMARRPEDRLTMDLRPGDKLPRLERLPYKPGLPGVGRLAMLPPLTLKGPGSGS